MSDARTDPSRRVLAHLPDILRQLEVSYKDIQTDPELSMHENRTAGNAAKWLADNGYEVTTGVGNTGVVGLLRNGNGPTVTLRADMDALPIREDTGLAYASTATAVDPSGQVTLVAHACGHDMHVTWLMGASALFAHARDAWRGTLIALFQPGEETARGARAMIEDGLFTRFPKPETGVESLVAAALAWNAAR